MEGNVPKRYSSVKLLRNFSKFLLNVFINDPHKSTVLDLNF